jgi:hypothetical protein
MTVQQAAPEVADCTHARTHTHTHTYTHARSKNQQMRVRKQQTDRPVHRSTLLPNTRVLLKT